MAALVSVIIVNWNGAADLRTCLAALTAQTYAPLEMIVIDNASTDHSCQEIEAFQAQSGIAADSPPALNAPTLRLIRNSGNVGFCRGNNQGIRASGGEFVLLLNADVTLAPQFVAAVVTLMQADPAIGIVVGKLLSGYPPQKIDSTGIVIYKNRRAFDRGQGEEDIGQYQRVEEVFGASGAACLYRRAMLEDIKYPGDEYLDELFFAYKEDVDLSWRARLGGWKCVYTPAAVGWHYRTWGAGQRQAIPKWIRRHSFKNRYLMLLKNEQGHTFWPHWRSILWYELRSLGYLLVKEPYLLSVVGELLRCWPEIKAKRRSTQSHVRQREGTTPIRAWFQ